MSYWTLFLSTYALYALLNFLLLPKMASAWKSNRSSSKIARAGTLAAAELIRDLAWIGVVMYGLFGILVALSHLLPANVTLLAVVVHGAGYLHAWIDWGKKTWESWYFVIVSAAILVLYWRAQKDAFTACFRRGLNSELDRLNAERLKKPEDWNKLAPNAAMETLTATIDGLRLQVSELGTENNSTWREKRQALLREISRLEEQRAAVDYERRVDPRATACQTPEPPPRNNWQRLRRALLSKGFFQDLKGLNKLLPRLTFAAVAIALIGVGSQAGLSEALKNRLVQLDDLRVSMKKKEVEEQWKKAAPATPPPAPDQPPPDNSPGNDDRRAVAHLANHFSRALSRNAAWQPFGRSASFTRALQRDLARHEIIANVQPPEGAPKRAAQAAANKADDAAELFTTTEREVVEDLVRKPGVPDSHLGAKVTSRANRYTAPMGARWERAKAAILRHASLYSEPVRLNDLQSALVDRIVATTVETTIDIDPLNDVEKLARSTLSSAAKKSANEAVDIEFKRTLLDLADGTPFEEAMEHVRTRQITMPAGYADEVASLMKDRRMPRPEDVEAKMNTRRNWRPAPTDLGDADEAKKIVDEIASQATQGGRFSLQEEAVDGLATYEDHFPSSGGGGGGGSGLRLGRGGAPHLPGGGGAARTVLASTLERHRLAGDVELFRKAHLLRVQRAGSFRMLRGFSRVGGVLIGEEPENPGTVLNFRDLQWQITGRAVTLLLRHKNGTEHRLGPFDPSLVHQSLAYAADGRPVAVTMTKARPLPQLKIHLHPALLDSPVGCRVTELDRFVDTFTSETLPEREQITERYRSNTLVYDFAWAHRLAAVLGEAVLSREPKLAQSIRLTQSDPGIVEAVTAALRNPAPLNSADSLYARKPEFFDRRLVAQIRECAASSKDAAAFGACIGAGSPSEMPKDSQAQAKLFTRAEFEPWSGVRERKFRLTEDLAFLRPAGKDGLDGTLWPLDFIIQIAFTSPVVEPPKGQSADEYVDENPLEFREIQPKIAQQVWAGIQRGKLEPMFEDLRNFTILQRLFRQVLAGRMGADFPLEKLGSLTRATAGSVPYSHTRRWNGSFVNRVRAEMLFAVESSRGRSDAWLPASRRAAERCAAALGRKAKGDDLAGSCNFGDAAPLAQNACRSERRGVACQWARLAGLAPRLPDLERMERAFGVMADDEKSHGEKGCPALAAPPPNLTADSGQRRAQ